MTERSEVEEMLEMVSIVIEEAEYESSDSSGESGEFKGLLKEAIAALRIAAEKLRAAGDLL